MPVKNVYVNDVLIGQASTWVEVNALLKSKGLRFLGTPGAAEGPTGFYLDGTLLEAGAKEPGAASGAA